MGRSNVLAALALLVLLAAAAPLVSASKADVNIFNEVGEQVRLHCHSGSADLKEQMLPPGGKFGWGFTPSYFKNTLYWCHFAWRNHVVGYTVWKDTGILGQATRFCTHCEWHLRTDGFWRNEAGKPPKWMKGWKQP